MKTNTRTLLATSSLSLLLATGSIGAVSAMAKPITDTSSTTNQQVRITAIKTAGDKEIGRRLTTLGTLTTKINAAPHLSASDKSTLGNEVSSETSGLNALKTKLDAETTFDGTKADATSIYSDYRVYALVVPKVQLVKVADDQQMVEAKLSALATKLQARLTSAKDSGKDTTSLQNQLNNMTAKTNAAQTISSSTESKVVNLQPSDYNSNHAVLSGDRDQLKTAHADNLAAAADAKAIVAGVKNL